MHLFISSLSLHQIGLPHIRLYYYESAFVGISTEVFKLRQAIVYLHKAAEMEIRKDTPGHPVHLYSQNNPKTNLLGFSPQVRLW